MANLIGRRIADVRPLTADEMESEGWDPTGRFNPVGMVVVLDDGTKLYPSRDEEGNGPGVFFGFTQDGSAFGLCAGGVS